MSVPISITEGKSTMIPYQKLSQTGKLRRLCKLALQGLTHYDLKNPQLSCYAFETNLLYKVTTETGEQFMLRLAYPGWRTSQDLCAEAAWLNALDAETDIPVPVIKEAHTGESVLSIGVPGIPDQWNLSLMRCMPGRLLGHYLTPRNLEKMGVLFAKLHQHGAAWTPPEGFTTRRFEGWLSRGEPNLVTGSDAIDSPIDDIPQRDLLVRMDERVTEAYAAINRMDLRVIHCDLWHDNIKLYKGVLHPIDFEDTVWGYRAHDIAMAMLDLLETVGQDRYAVLLTCFQQG